ncbi:MAG TPA: AMP-binding protein, partial [Pirellulales bacterium]|nr:AMP-binding protein [Pirellulales bacterium]
MTKPLPVDENATPWVEGLTMPQVLRETAGRYPDHDALVFPALNLRVNYREFSEQVDDAARGLLALGIKHGEHVAIWATNVPEWVVLQFAAARVGAVLVNINPAYRPFELKYVLNQSDSVALFLVERFKTSHYFQMLAEVCPELASSRPGEPHSHDFPKLRWVVALEKSAPAGGITWGEMLRRGQSIPKSKLDEADMRLEPAQAINIQYTSGTTGFPKAAMLSHRNLLLNGYYTGMCQAFTADDRVCIPVPFYHCFGCVLGTITSVVHGAAMIVPAESFNPTATLEAIEKERATSLYGVPTMFIAQLQDPTLGGRDLKSLRTGIMAGSPCPIEVMRQVIDVLGAREITIGYGLTEASPIITQSRNTDPIEIRV